MSDTPSGAAPLPIVNPPGLSAIRYRVGTFTSFRRAMLDAVARGDLLDPTPNPFARWHEDTDGDYHAELNKSGSGVAEFYRGEQWDTDDDEEVRRRLPRLAARYLEAKEGP